MAVNVHSTAQTTENLSRIELLAWVNRTLLSEFRKVEELCTGAAYCQLMDVLFPGCLPLKRVKFCTNVEHDFLNNLRMFQKALVHLKVSKAVPIDRLAKGRFQDNFEFLQWFKKFFDANYDGKEYDPKGARNNAPMGYGTPSTLRPSQRMNTGTTASAGPRPLKRAGDTNGSSTRLQLGDSIDAVAEGDGELRAGRGEKQIDRISWLSEQIDDLAIKIQDVEMSREYYYNKLLLIENFINEHPEDTHDGLCEKVKAIMYATE
ncbi:microtubule-associated protein RP/EB family member 1-like [Anopheles maculipalpis]|uniref:microtubule-associated protein RP/EB family member 1-like n=1 Tax=Anopheles maculipalpis TaxID=1496333 RepID=UPI002158BD29|nr:microtubule-associated protein RP/EB family member 1-like [Anopheles maculipalpis]